MPRKILILNEKGGTGKTTISCHLCFSLAKRKKKTLLLDFDPQANATLYLGFLPKSPSIYDFLKEKVRFFEILKKINSFFYFLPSSFSLASLSLELFEKEDKEKFLSEKLSPFLKDFDFFVADSPPSFSLLSLNLLFLCEEILVPIQPEFFAKDSLKKLFEIIKLSEKNFQKKFKIYLLLSMFDKRTKISYEVEKKLQKEYQENFLPIKIPRTVKFLHLFGKKEGVEEKFPKTPAGEAFKNLSEILIKNYERA